MSSENTLLALVDVFNHLDQKLIESAGEMTPELETALAITEENMREKVDNYAYYIDHLESRAEYFKSIEANARAARQIFENQKERLRERLKFAMANLNRTDLEGDDFRYKLSPTKPRLVIDEKVLPDQYKVVTVTQVPDKDAIQKDLILGMKIEGCHFEESKALRRYVNSTSKKVVKK